MPDPIHYGPAPAEHTYSRLQLRAALDFMRAHVRETLLHDAPLPKAEELAELGRYAAWTTCKACGLEAMAAHVLETEVGHAA